MDTAARGRNKREADWESLAVELKSRAYVRNSTTRCLSNSAARGNHFRNHSTLLNSTFRNIRDVDENIRGHEFTQVRLVLQTKAAQCLMACLYLN